MVVEYPHIFPKVAKYQKMTPILAEYPRGYLAGIEPDIEYCAQIIDGVILNKDVNFHIKHKTMYKQNTYKLQF